MEDTLEGFQSYFLRLLVRLHGLSSQLPVFVKEVHRQYLFPLVPGAFLADKVASSSLLVQVQQQEEAQQEFHVLAFYR